MAAQQLTIVTLNTWKCEGRYRDRLDWMAEGLKALNPDFVLLQEAFVCKERGADTAAFLGKTLSLRAESLTGRCKPRLFEGKKRKSSSDLSVLGPSEPTERSEIPLTEHPEDLERAALRMVFAWQNHSLTIINTHLTHKSDHLGHLIRQRQLKELSEITSASTSEITVVGGDFNTTQDEIASLQSPTDLRLTPVRPQKKSHLGTMQGEAAPTLRHCRRIDHLFVYKSSASNIHVTFDEEAIAMNAPVGPRGEFPSDHAAVVARLSVASSSSSPPRQEGSDG